MALKLLTLVYSFPQMSSPFTSYKRMMKFYHFWVWTGGIVMGCITWGVSGAGGFFSVDGQSVKYHSDTDVVVGFCLASSRICCETGATCAAGVKLCSANSSFVDAQKWSALRTKKTMCFPNRTHAIAFVYFSRPWILIYSFVLLVVFVSVWCVGICLLRFNVYCYMTNVLVCQCSVLTLAWQRLYLRGVPKTYNIRLRVLNYISLYVVPEKGFSRAS